MDLLIGSSLYGGGMWRLHSASVRRRWSGDSCATSAAVDKRCSPDRRLWQTWEPHTLTQRLSCWSCLLQFRWPCLLDRWQQSPHDLRALQTWEQSPNEPQALQTWENKGIYLWSIMSETIDVISLDFHDITVY